MDFFRDNRSNDLNQLVFGAGGADISLLRWLDTCDIFELFCDGIRFGTGLAFGVDNLRLVAMSMVSVDSGIECFTTVRSGECFFFEPIENICKRNETN